MDAGKQKSMRKYFYYYIVLSFISSFLILSHTAIPAELAEQGNKPLQQETPQPDSSTMEGMVFIKGGCFEMGDVFGDGDPDEKPLHQVCVADYYIGRYEVTQGEWSKIMGDNPSFHIKCDDCPVENVSYKAVQEFIRRLNRRSGGKYRLPTEAEWEYAARSGGKKEKWAGMNSENELDDYAWSRGNSDGKTHPVGQKRANGLGIYDMCGNVQEWVSDYYDTEYYRTSLKDNPKGATGGQYRVSRGGSMLNKAWGIRTSIRYRFTQDDLGREFGFRLAAPPG